MLQAESVLQLLSRNGGSLSGAVSFNLKQVQAMEVFVRHHLAAGHKPINRGELNAKLKEYEPTRTTEGSRAVGFCFVVFAYNMLHESSPAMFYSPVDFLLKYPDFEKAEDKDKAFYTCNMMKAALHILEGKNNKGALVEIVARICDGVDAYVITGGGKIGDQKRMLRSERFYVEESGIEPMKTRKGTKRKHSEAIEAAAEEPVEDNQPVVSRAEALSTNDSQEYAHIDSQDTWSMPVSSSLPMLDDLEGLFEKEEEE